MKMPIKMLLTQSRMIQLQQLVIIRMPARNNLIPAPVKLIVLLLFHGINMTLFPAMRLSSKMTSKAKRTENFHLDGI